MIGSGATAVTIVPAVVANAAHVTMLQRTPTDYFSAPNLEKLIAVLARVVPTRWIYGTLRSSYIVLQRALYKGAKRWPGAMREFLLRPIKCGGLFY